MFAAKRSPRQLRVAIVATLGNVFRSTIARMRKRWRAFCRPFRIESRLGLQDNGVASVQMKKVVGSSYGFPIVLTCTCGKPLREGVQNEGNGEAQRKYYCPDCEKTPILINPVPLKTAERHLTLIRGGKR